MAKIATALPEPWCEDAVRFALRQLARRTGRRRPRVIALHTPSLLPPAPAEREMGAALIHIRALGAAQRTSPRSEFGELAEPTDQIPRPLERWLSTRSRTPTALWAPSAWFQPRRTIALARLGLSEVIVEGEDDGPAPLAVVLERLLHDARAHRFLDVLPPSLPDDLRALIKELLSRGTKWPTTHELAARVHCDRSTLFRKFRRASLPPPRQLTTWIRLYLALDRIEDGWSPPRAAAATGFSTSSNLFAMARSRLDLGSAEEFIDLGTEELLRALSRKLK